MPKTKAKAPALFEPGEIADAPEPLCEQALSIWNDIAPSAGWPTAKFLTEARRRAIKRAVKDYGGLIGWRSHLEKASKNAFLTGKTDKGDKHAKWRPDLDWFLKPATVVKILEEKFPADAAPVGISIAKHMDPSDEWGRWMRNYEPGRFWPPSNGPRPEHPGCRVTPSILVAWRARFNIVIDIPKAESRADRLRHSIASYRRVENYKRANELEQELADLEKRSAVLVPAPEVSDLGMPKADASLVNRPKHTVSDVPYEEVPDWDADIPEGDESQAEP